LSEIKKRKSEHIQICLERDVQSQLINTGFSDIHLIHRAIPRSSLQDVDLSITLFDHTLSAPLIIEAMTGGTKKAAKINEALAEAASHFNVAMGVGSQRVALEDPGVESTFKVAREKAPHILLIGNLGLPQILEDSSLVNISRAIKMIDADAFAIHLNILQEAMQPDGDTYFTNFSADIKEIVSKTPVPLIAKETGSGIAFEEAQLLEDLGFKAIDVGGAGGTSWAAVEYHRARINNYKLQERLGNVFWDWGIPTAVSTFEVSQKTQLKVISSGGIRTGVDAAKAIALGADAFGLAIPLLKPALDGDLNSVFQMFINELKTAMFLVGARSIKELKNCPLVITGKTGEWLQHRGFKPEKFARRKSVS